MLIEFYIYIYIFASIHFFSLVIIFFIIASFLFVYDPFCRYTWQGFRNTDKVSKSVPQRRHEKELLEGGYHILTAKGGEWEKRRGGTLN